MPGFLSKLSFGCLAIATIFCSLTMSLSSQEESVIIQTLNFEDITKRAGTYEFPPAGQRWEKILMHYTLKCDERTTADNFPCGEWDYIANAGVIDSSGTLDSTRKTQPNFRVDGAARDMFAYTTEASFSRYLHLQKVASFTAESERKELRIGEGTSAGTAVFGHSSAPGRSLFLWRADELLAGGLEAGLLHGLRLNVADAGAELENLRISMAASSLTELDESAFSTGDLSEVYFQTTTLGAAGWHEFVFHSPFNWDGSSNLLIEFSFTNGDAAKDNMVMMNEAEFDAGLATAGRDGYLRFSGQDYLEVPPAAFAAIDQEVTISLWQYGDPAIQPQSDYLFEGYDAAGNRVLNVHLPWGNGQIYWDAGNQGNSYDRIQKEATADEFEGRWNHWAFVKNAATGSMRMYLNGKLWHSGNGLSRRIEDVASFKLGSRGNGQGNYDGSINEFRVWNVELDEATIAEWMGRDLDPSHPYYNNLQVYYKFDEGSGVEAADASANGYAAQFAGAPQWRLLAGDAMTRNAQASKDRPHLSLLQGDFDLQVDEVKVYEQVENDRVELVRYENPGFGVQIPEADPAHPTIPTSTMLVWPADAYTYTYDADGNAVDSTFVEAEQTLERDDWVYFSPIVRFELGRFITPYGIGLDLGPDGWTWIYDVSDYAPLLHGYVYLWAHNQQELIDLKFEFVPGTPPRDIVTIANVYDGSHSYGSIADDINFPARQIVPDERASQYKLRTTISGHGWDNETRCAEFCPKQHHWDIDGERRFQWQVWMECGDNPLYPQGGTWLLDRGGWCPGAPVATYHQDITPYVSPGTPVEINYGVEDYAPDPAQGNYVVRSQLVAYGPINHRTDAALVDILAPNDGKLHSRFNPICGNPVIRIRNTGAIPLTSVDIEYGVKGGGRATYTWQGSLEFLEEEDVTLPVFDWGSWDGANVFEARLSNPNGVLDEYANNNYRSAGFQLTPEYFPELEILLQTNLRAREQYEWSLRNDKGEVIGSGANLDDSRLYEESFVLEEGCYEFRLDNRLGFGLDSWFLRDDLGTGSLRFNSLGQRMVSFQPDFGNYIVHQFRVVEKPAIVASTDLLDYGHVAVNGKKLQTLEVSPANDKGLLVTDIVVTALHDAFSIESITPPLGSEGVRLEAGEKMLVQVAFQPGKDGTLSATMRVESNDERFPSKRVRLTGVGGLSTSVNITSPHANTQLQLDATPNPISSETLISYTLDAPQAVEARLVLVNSLGQELALLFEGSLRPDTYTQRFNREALPSGVYFLQFRTAGAAISKQILVVE